MDPHEFSTTAEESMNPTNVPIVIEPGAPIIHVGVPADDKALADIRERKKGRKLYWILSEAEYATFSAVPDEVRMVWKNDTQLRRLLHDSTPMWLGGEFLPPGERMEQVTRIVAELLDLHGFNESSNVVLSKGNQPTRNAVRNWRWFEDGLHVKRLKDSGKDLPVVIMAAGPSLNSQWPYLRDYRKRHPEVPFICAGRTYKKA